MLWLVYHIRGLMKMSLLSLTQRSGVFPHCFTRKSGVSWSKWFYFVNSRKVSNNAWKNSHDRVRAQVEVGDRKLVFSSGHLARFADGSATAQLGDTSVMVTAVSRGSSDIGSFFPLTVDYRQKAAAAGRIPTNHLRREMTASDTEILTSRMIDRSIRPMFPASYRTQTQVVCNVLAMDGDNDPCVVAINAASAALCLSDIPWSGPVGAVRVGLVDGEVVINPTRRQLTSSDLNMVITALDKHKIVMIEASGEVVPRDLFQTALRRGTEAAQSIVSRLTELTATAGKEKRVVPSETPPPQHLVDLIQQMTSQKIEDVLCDFTHHKISRDVSIQDIKAKAIEELLEKFPDLSHSQDVLVRIFDNNYKSIFRSLVLKSKTRCDGRSLTDLRDLSCEVDLYPPLHGSALFQRGQTQVMCTLTFDSLHSAAKVDTVSALLSGMNEKNFFLHYEFPPYATNETGRIGGRGRREIGHGALAEKALRPVVPHNYPFTIRLNAEVLESNGSSSMATVCAGSLALMDAGVPVSEAAAGVAVGLITDTDRATGEISDHCLLTDILGIEDYLGDMDFKMAGTETGLTALQADIKIAGLPLDLALEATSRAHDAIKIILKTMKATLSEPRLEGKVNQPVSEVIEVAPGKRAAFVGPGGYNLKKIMSETGVTVTQKDEQSFHLFAPHQTAMDEAQTLIDQILSEQTEMELEFGGIYQATITEIRDYGVMVQLFKGQTPVLLHNSQLDQRKVNHPSAINLTVGQEISVKYFGRDPASGKMRLSRKVLQGLPSPVSRNLLTNS